MAHRIAEKQPEVAPLRVLPRGTAMVPDYGSLMSTGTRRFHGMRFDSKLGPEFRDERDGQTKNHGGFVIGADQVVTIAADDPHYREYVRHLRDGDLWAADPETAAAAGVAFEGHFTGEHPETAARFAEKTKSGKPGTRVPNPDPQPAVAAESK